MDLSSRILGPNSVTQAALSHILKETPETYYEDILNQLEVELRRILSLMRQTNLFLDQCQLCLPCTTGSAWPSSRHAARYTLT